MKVVVFGLTISSSRGNSHAAVWRALAAGLAQRGHTLVFFERDEPSRASYRDLLRVPGGELVLYRRWHQVADAAREHLLDAFAGIVTSFCPDALAAENLLQDVNLPVRAFYDLDTPITLAWVNTGRPVPWLGPHGLAGYDLVLSFTGGRALDSLVTRLGAVRVEALYGSVDPIRYRPVPERADLSADLSYLGTYAYDRQRRVDQLFAELARRLPAHSFLLAGTQHSPHRVWPGNVRTRKYVRPDLRPAFYCSSRLTLQLARGPMAAMGHCPPARLFEAAACGATIVSDHWPGLEQFFTPGREILIARTADDIVALLARPREQLRAVGAAARARAIAAHTGSARAATLVDALFDVARGHYGISVPTEAHV